MKQNTIALSIFLLGLFAQAELITESGDWSAQKDIMTPLEKMGCVAETTTDVEVDGMGTVEKWTLQVIKLADGDGAYSFPIVISFPEAQPTNEYYEASGQTNKTDTQMFKMTLLQPGSGDKSIVAAKVADRNLLVGRLKADSTFNMNYLVKEEATRSAKFSLRGSSNSINRMMEVCQ